MFVILKSFTYQIKKEMYILELKKNILKLVILIKIRKDCSQLKKTTKNF